MGCFLVLFALISPRLALFVTLVFTDWVGDALNGWVLPVLGFFLLPWTTLAYIVMWQITPGVAGFEWFIVVLAFFVDLGSYARYSSSRASRA
jgi:hypothetical protein